jgi:hypothetical protein
MLARFSSALQLLLLALGWAHAGKISLNEELLIGYVGLLGLSCHSCPSNSLFESEMRMQETPCFLDADGGARLPGPQSCCMTHWRCAI